MVLLSVMWGVSGIFVMNTWFPTHMKPGMINRNILDGSWLSKCLGLRTEKGLQP